MQEKKIENLICSNLFSTCLVGIQWHTYLCMSTVHIWIFSCQGNGVILFTCNVCPTCHHPGLSNGPSWRLWKTYMVPTAWLNVTENLLIALQGEHAHGAGLAQPSESFCGVVFPASSVPGVLQGWGWLCWSECRGGCRHWLDLAPAAAGQSRQWGSGFFLGTVLIYGLWWRGFPRPAGWRGTPALAGHDVVRLKGSAAAAAGWGLMVSLSILQLVQLWGPRRAVHHWPGMQALRIQAVFLPVLLFRSWCFHQDFLSHHWGLRCLDTLNYIFFMSLGWTASHLQGRAMPCSFWPTCALDI